MGVGIGVGRGVGVGAGVGVGGGASVGVGGNTATVVVTMAPTIGVGRDDAGEPAGVPTPATGLPALVASSGGCVGDAVPDSSSKRGRPKKAPAPAMATTSTVRAAKAVGES